ncbi:MAG: programmed cell death protein 5 [Thermoplasmata archaeon]|jgi:programmed cell death protein 5|nr:programmed cell death protein 5 [Thermoplasmata archaeon]
MDDLEAARRRRLAELQAQQARAAAQDPAAQAQAEARRAAAEEAALERLLQQVLEPEARERLTRIRMSRPDLAAAVANQLATLAQQGRLARRLSDVDLRQVLAQLTPKDRDISITRK